MKLLIALMTWVLKRITDRGHVLVEREAWDSAIAQIEELQEQLKHRPIDTGADHDLSRSIIQMAAAIDDRIPYKGPRLWCSVFLYQEMIYNGYHGPMPLFVARWLARCQFCGVELRPYSTPIRLFPSTQESSYKDHYRCKSSCGPDWDATPFPIKPDSPPVSGINPKLRERARQIRMTDNTLQRWINIREKLQYDLKTGALNPKSELDVYAWCKTVNRKPSTCIQTFSQLGWDDLADVFKIARNKAQREQYHSRMNNGPQR